MSRKKNTEWKRKNEELCLRGNPYWSHQLERWLNHFGASPCDPPELDPETAQTPKQPQVAARVHRKHLVR